MVELKLGRLPNRKSARISFEAHPDLALALDQYADAYRKTYGQAEPVAELVPFMLEAFLRSDREFAKLRDRAKPPTRAPTSNPPAGAAPAPAPSKPEG